MSDTPRTDANVTGNSDPTQDEYEDLAAFARQLERENSLYHSVLKRLVDDCMASDFNEHWESFIHAERLLANAASEPCGALHRKQDSR